MHEREEELQDRRVEHLPHHPLCFCSGWVCVFVCKSLLAELALPELFRLFGSLKVGRVSYKYSYQLLSLRA